jgi:glycosyltransferase involved in cell wall biosynthesis
MIPISFYIVAKNEIYWIEQCLVSIRDVANEIIFVDNGSIDGTCEKVEAIKNKLGMNIKIYKEAKILDLADLRNFAISKCSNDWVFVWDADFVAFTEEDPYPSLKDALLFVDKEGWFKKFHNIQTKTPCMRTFMGKTWDYGIVHPPNTMMFNKNMFKKVTVADGYGTDARLWKDGCKALTLDAYYFISVDVKSDYKTLIRNYRSKWRLARFRNQFKGNLLQYVKENLRKEKETPCSWIINNLYNKKMINFQYMVPKSLHPFFDNPPYKIEKRDGQIVRRIFDYKRLRELK